MKKKILVIFTGAMELGGIEKSLLGLLDSIPYNEYEVDLFLYSHNGPLLQYINPLVNILPEVKELAYLRNSFKDKLTHGCFYSAWRRVVDGLAKIGNDSSWKKVLDHVIKPLPQKYDIALGFFAPYDLLRDYVSARVKIGWIHTDYSHDNEKNMDYLHSTYRGLDYIAAVSDDCRKVFAELLPEFSGKLLTVENVLPQSLVYSQAAEFVPEDMQSDSFKLLSIGRFCHAKNFDNIPEITAIMRQSGVDVKWYIIGFGTDEQLIKDKISEYGMEEHVIILGKKTNPYPYIKACDMYVQPSRYEGKCVAVREAQMLAKPVAITRYRTSAGQLEEGVDGVIVPMDNRECALALAELIRDDKLRKKLISNCNARDYSNRNSTVQLFQFVEGIK